MKIVRVTISAGGQKFYIDQSYNDKKTDYENCDAALAFITDSVKKQEAMAVMLMGEGRHIKSAVVDEKDTFDPFFNARPAILNMAQVALVTIDNAGVYDVEQGKKSDE